MNRKSLALVLAAVTAVPGVGHAAAPACERWNTTVTECQVYPNVPNCASGGLTFSQRRNWKSKLYAKNFEDACANWKKYAHPNQSAPHAADWFSQTQVRCSVDDNLNGAPDDATQTVLYKEPDVKESCCSRVPNGPNSFPVGDHDYVKLIHLGTGAVLGIMSRPPAYGREFSSLSFWHDGVQYKSQVERIRSRNKARFGGPSDVNTWKSDLYTGNVPALIALEAPECNGLLSNASGASWACMPQVHHIVPRVDENGCDCGENSNTNALVISAKLNGSMSNNCNDPKMITIMDKWAPETMVAQSGPSPADDAVKVALELRRSRAMWQQSLLAIQAPPTCEEGGDVYAGR